VTVETGPVTLTQRLLRDLLREVPSDGETYFHGIVRTPDAVALKPDPEAYEVLKAGLSALELRFARPRDLEDPKVGSLFVLSGLVLVQTIRRAEAAPAPTPAARLAAVEFDDVTELFIAHLTDPARELLVREGDRVQRGQLLARLTWQDPELERKRQQAAAELAEREATQRLRYAAVGQARKLVDVGLAAPGGLAKGETDLLAAREAVAQAHRVLERLTDDARRLTEVRAPVDGQILSVRVHVIHGSEGTAALRLLYRKTTEPPRAPGG
jgi:hypothetical protein